MKSLRLSLIVLFVIVAAPARAQTPASGVGSILGTVVDAESKEPLSAVVVRLVEANRSHPTHDQGEFGFTGVRPGRYTLTVERIGYRTVSRAVEVRERQSASVRIELRPAAIQLGQVLVTGTVGARSGRDVLSPATTVSGAEMERKMDGTVAATLATEPGMAVASIGPATARPVIRGLGGDRILILEDGIRPGDLSSTSGDHAVAIEPLTARRFEVVRGPMSLLYGSSALGGVVNVVREEIPNAVPDELHGTATMQAASVNRSGALGAYGLTGIGSFALRGEASVRASDDVKTPVGELVNTGARTVSLAGGGSYVSDWGHAGASYRFYDNHYGIPGGFVGAHAEGVDIDMRRHTLRGQLQVQPEGTLFSSIEVDGVYTDYAHAELDNDGGVGTRFAQDMASLEATGRHTGRGPFSQGAVGIRAQYRDIQTGGSLKTPSTYDWTLAAFAVEELGTGPLRFQLGARYDWARYTPRDTTAFVFAGGRRIPVRERSFGSVSGSLGVLYAFSDAVRAGASVSRAYRTPDFNELYSNGPHLAANSYDVGDPELGEETGLGMDAYVRMGGERGWAEVAVFRNTLDHYIFPSSRGRAELGAQGGRPRFQYSNEDARFVGAEGDFEVSLTPRLVLTGTASYVRAEFTSKLDSIPAFEGGDTTFVAASEHPPMIPPLHGHVGVRYERKSYFGGVGLRVAAEQERLGDFEAPTDGYVVGDLSAGIRFSRGARFHTVTLKVDNLFDTEYYDHLSRIKEIMPEPGRNVSVLYRLTY